MICAELCTIHTRSTTMYQYVKAYGIMGNVITSAVHVLFDCLLEPQSYLMNAVNFKSKNELCHRGQHH